MYKAIHVLTGEEIIILHPHWRRRVDELRGMAQADLLVCQGCRQPLRVKAGQVKRPHFAHKHLKACSLGSESLEILKARAVLYEWLHRQFDEQVTLEKAIEGAGLPRPVDCWVEAESGPFAYWIIPTGIKLEPRQAIKAAFERLGARVHYLFLAGMLIEEKREFHSLLLTPTERAFLQPTPFDEMLAGAGEVGTSIHYLEPESATLTTYRSLALFHRPNWFKGLKKVSPLAEVRANRADGGLVHAGENDRLTAFRGRQHRLAEKRRKFHENEARGSAGGAELGPGVQHAAAQPDEGAAQQGPVRAQALSPVQPSEPHLPTARDRLSPAARPAGVQPLPCATCGQVTANYWSTFYDEHGRKLCRCRECLERGM